MADRNFQKKKRNDVKRKRKPVMLITAEGRNKTEKQYFNSFQDQHGKYSIRFATGLETDPVGMLKAMEKAWKKNELSEKDGDKAYIVLGLAFELCNTYYLSGVGYIFIELNEEDREKLLTRMILRSKLFTRMMQASVNGKVNMREFLYMLSDSTYVRRRSNVKKMMGYLIQSDEYDFTEFIDIIEL